MEKYKENNFTREQELEMIKNSEVEIARDEGIEQNKISVAKNMLLKGTLSK